MRTRNNVYLKCFENFYLKLFFFHFAYALLSLIYKLNGRYKVLKHFMTMKYGVARKF